VTRRLARCALRSFAVGARRGFPPPLPTTSRMAASTWVCKRADLSMLRWSAQRSIATPEAGKSGAIKPADSARTPAKSTDSVTNSIEFVLPH